MGPISVLLLALLSAFLFGFLASMVWIAVRLWLCLPVFPPQSRLHRLRWNGETLLLIFFCFLLMPSLLTATVKELTGTTAETVQTVRTETLLTETPPAISSAEVRPAAEDDPAAKSLPAGAETSAGAERASGMGNEKKSHHVVFEYLSGDPSPEKYIFLFLYVVFLGPFFEEFLFRFILQGWLDSRERERFGMRRFRNRFAGRCAQKLGASDPNADGVRRPLIRHRTNCCGWRSLILAAFFFAFLHFHGATDTYPSKSLLQIQFFCTAVSYVLILLGGFSILHFRDGFSLREMGLDLSHWKTDMILGAFLFFCTAPLSYLCQFLLAEPLNGICAPDFISLIPLALGFGFLYMRTRRLLPGFTAHALFNGFSFTAFFLSSKMELEFGMMLVSRFS